MILCACPRFLVLFTLAGGYFFILRNLRSVFLGRSKSILERNVEVGIGTKIGEGTGCNLILLEVEQDELLVDFLDLFPASITW